MKLINWVLFEVVVCLMTANLSYILHDKDGQPQQPAVVCHTNTRTKICIVLMVR